LFRYGERLETIVDVFCGENDPRVIAAAVFAVLPLPDLCKYRGGLDASQVPPFVLTIAKDVLDQDAVAAPMRRLVDIVREYIPGSHGSAADLLTRFRVYPFTETVAQQVNDTSMPPGVQQRDAYAILRHKLAGFLSEIGAPCRTLFSSLMADIEIGAALEVIAQCQSWTGHRRKTLSYKHTGKQTRPFSDFCYGTLECPRGTFSGEHQADVCADHLRHSQGASM
jgi:hypothetical protein